MTAPEGVSPQTEPSRLDEEEVAAFEGLLADLTPSELLELRDDPEAQQTLAHLAQLKVHLGRLDSEQLLALRRRLDDEYAAPLFSEEEWALITSDPSDRQALDAFLRTDPAALADMRSRVARVQRDRNSRLSPMAKQWLIRVGVGFVVGLIALANQHK